MVVPPCLWLLSFPFERALAAGAPVSDISKLGGRPGEINVAPAGKPVGGQPHRRNRKNLAKLDGKLVDPKSEAPQPEPEYCKNAHRSIAGNLLLLASAPPGLFLNLPVLTWPWLTWAGIGWWLLPSRAMRSKFDPRLPAFTGVKRMPNMEIPAQIPVGHSACWLMTNKRRVHTNRASKKLFWTDRRPLPC